MAVDVELAAEAATERMCVPKHLACAATIEPIVEHDAQSSVVFSARTEHLSCLE